MGNLKKHFIFVFFMICGFCCYAGQISIQVVQHDKIQKNLSENSLVIEDELLTGFFENGYIVTDECMRTNIDGVFAIGDIRQTPLRQIVTACSDGAIAATKCFEIVKALRAKK